MRHALVAHDGLDIRKVEVDDRGHVDQVCDPLYSLLQDLIGLLERFGKCRPAVHDLQQFVIGDHDQGIHVFLNILDTGLRAGHAASRLKAERLCHDADCKDALLLGELGNDRCSSGSCSAAHAAGNENHIGALDRVCDLVSALFRSLHTYLGICTGTQALCQLFSYLKQLGGSAELQGLDICVNAYELNACNVHIHHSVYCIVPSSANTDNDNLASCLSIICFNLEHGDSLLQNPFFFIKANILRYF